MKKSDKTIIDHIPDFLDYCEVEKGLRDNTQKNYQRYLHKFTTWLKAKNLTSLLPHQLTSEHIWEYRLYLSRYQKPRQKGFSGLESSPTLKKSTQNYYLIALRAFLGYFVAKDVVSLPPDKITLPKGDKREKTLKFLTVEQIEKLLTSADANDYLSIRNRAMLEVLFSTGLRIAELVSLNMEQFANIKNKADLELGIIGKGGNPRTVYFSERALTWIKKWLSVRNAKAKALFINLQKENDDNGNRLTPRSVERIVKKYAVLAGIPLFTTPHTLRHSYATDLMTQGADLRTVQEFLGHKNIATTQIYTHVTNKRLREAHRQFHSGKNMKN
jgi:site-specific recombinase XerD